LRRAIIREQSVLHRPPSPWSEGGFRAPTQRSTSTAGSGSGPILLCMGLFSRFWIPALRRTAHGVAKTRVTSSLSLARGFAGHASPLRSSRGCAARSRVALAAPGFAKGYAEAAYAASLRWTEAGLPAEAAKQRRLVPWPASNYKLKTLIINGSMDVAL